MNLKINGLNFDITALERIGWPARQAWPAGWEAVFATFPEARPARVVEQHRSGYVVAQSMDEAEPAESFPDWMRPRCERRSCG